MMMPDFHPRLIRGFPASNLFSCGKKKEAARWDSSRICFCPIVFVLLGALAATGVLDAQEPPKKNTTQDSGLVLRQTVRRVRVDVVVTDAQGHLVTGLQASDFRVAEDGKPQSIRTFEYRSDDYTEAALPKRPPLPSQTFMNLPASPEHGPLTVLLYDILNTPWDDQFYAREQIVSFLKKSPGRRIAIFILGNRLRFLQGFTSDMDSIERAMKDPSTKPQRSDISYSAPSGTEDMARLKDGTGADKTVSEMIAARKELEETEASARMDLRAEMTLDALKQIGRFLSGTPGRKNLIWYSGSFPAAILPNSSRTHQFDGNRNYNDRIKAATNLLNSAEVAVYPIDAHGLQTDPSVSASRNTVFSGSGAPNVSQSFFAKHSAEIATMEVIGEQTGGRAFYNTNGLDQALEKASAEGSSYYSLVYAPTNSKFDGSVRRISVHLGHGHNHLAYRRSYIADDIASIAHEQSAPDQGTSSPDQTPASTKLAEAAEQFGAPPSRQLIFTAYVDAVGAPVPATAEQIAALVPYREQAAKNARRKFVQPKTPISMQQYAIAYAVLVSQLDLPKSANGAYHSDISMAALAFDQDGETLWGTETRLKDEIPASKIDNIRKDGFQAVQTFSIPVETAVIRLVVRDEHSERIGSMEIRLPLTPDQKQGAGAR